MQSFVGGGVKDICISPSLWTPVESQVSQQTIGFLYLDFFIASGNYILGSGSRERREMAWGRIT